MPREKTFVKGPGNGRITDFAGSDMDFEVRSLDAMYINESRQVHPWWYNFKYLAVGIIFGIVLIKTEVVSWFRIQEMFHLQRFHMFGVIGTAVVVGMISVWVIKKFKIKTIHGKLLNFILKNLTGDRYTGGCYLVWDGHSLVLVPAPYLPNRQRCIYHRGCTCKCRCGHLGIWLLQAFFAALKRKTLLTR